MSTTVKFTISDSNYDRLCELAAESNLSIQDYIRGKLFSEYNTITPMDAINKALTKSKGEMFTVPELFGDDWQLPNGVAGVFGKRFFALVSSEFSSQIRFTGTLNTKKHAVYEIL